MSIVYPSVWVSMALSSTSDDDEDRSEVNTLQSLHSATYHSYSQQQPYIVPSDQHSVDFESLGSYTSVTPSTVSSVGATYGTTILQSHSKSTPSLVTTVQSSVPSVILLPTTVPATVIASSIQDNVPSSSLIPQSTLYFPSTTDSTPMQTTSGLPDGSLTTTSEHVSTTESQETTATSNTTTQTETTSPVKPVTPPVTTTRARATTDHLKTTSAVGSKTTQIHPGLITTSKIYTTTFTSTSTTAYVVAGDAQLGLIVGLSVGVCVLLLVVMGMGILCYRKRSCLRQRFTNKRLDKGKDIGLSNMEDMKGGGEYEAEMKNGATNEAFLKDEVTDTSRELYTVVYPYSAQQASELSVVEGESLRILLQEDSNWWVACKPSTGEEGWVPASYVERRALISDEVQPLSNKCHQMIDSSEGYIEIQSASENNVKDKRLSSSYEHLQSWTGGILQCEVLYPYESHEDGDLNVLKGDILEYIEGDPLAWVKCYSQRTHEEGWVPATYLEEITRQQSAENASLYEQLKVNNRESAQGLTAAVGIEHISVYNYESEVDGDLSFQAGEIILVLEMLDNGWWLGCIGIERNGWFPGNLLELPGGDDLLMFQAPSAPTIHEVNNHLAGPVGKDLVDNLGYVIPADINLEDGDTYQSIQHMKPRPLRQAPLSPPSGQARIQPLRPAPTAPPDVFKIAMKPPAKHSGQPPLVQPLRPAPTTPQSDPLKEASRKQPTELINQSPVREPLRPAPKVPLSPAHKTPSSQQPKETPHCTSSEDEVAGRQKHDTNADDKVKPFRMAPTTLHKVIQLNKTAAGKYMENVRSGNDREDDHQKSESYSGTDDDKTMQDDITIKPHTTTAPSIDSKRIPPSYPPPRLPPSARVKNQKANDLQEDTKRSVHTIPQPKLIDLKTLANKVTARFRSNSDISGGGDASCVGRERNQSDPLGNIDSSQRTNKLISTPNLIDTTMRQSRLVKRAPERPVAPPKNNVRFVKVPEAALDVIKRSSRSPTRPPPPKRHNLHVHPGVKPKRPSRPPTRPVLNRLSKAPSRQVPSRPPPLTHVKQEDGSAKPLPTLQSAVAPLVSTRMHRIGVSHNVEKSKETNPFGVSLKHISRDSLQLPGECTSTKEKPVAIIHPSGYRGLNESKLKVPAQTAQQSLVGSNSSKAIQMKDGTATDTVTWEKDDELSKSVDNPLQGESYINKHFKPVLVPKPTKVLKLSPQDIDISKTINLNQSKPPKPAIASKPVLAPKPAISPKPMIGQSHPPCEKPFAALRSQAKALSENVDIIHPPQPKPREGAARRTALRKTVKSHQAASCEELSFDVGSFVKDIRQVPGLEGWRYGMLADGTTGMYPTDCVEVARAPHSH